MFAEITIDPYKGQRDEGYFITMFYESGVQYVSCDYEKGVVSIKLHQDYTAKQLVREYNISTQPFVHAYENVVRVHVAEK